MTKAAAITDAEFSGGIEKVFGANGVEVHRKATDVMAVWQVSMPIHNDPDAKWSGIPVPAKAVKYNEFEYGRKRFILYYEELNGETQER